MEFTKITKNTTFYEFYQACKNHQQQNKDCESCEYYLDCKKIEIVFPHSWFNEGSSYFTKNSLTCADCARAGVDSFCMTRDENGSPYEGGNLCPGFIALDDEDAIKKYLS